MSQGDGTVCLSEAERAVTRVPTCVHEVIFCVDLDMGASSLFRKQINVSAESHFPVKYKETQSADTNREERGERGREVKAKLIMNGGEETMLCFSSCPPFQNQVKKISQLLHS